MLDDLIIRPYDPEKDLEDAAQCFYEGFHNNMWPILDQATPGFRRDIIRLFSLISPDSFSAEIQGRVRGILLGAAPMRASGMLRAAAFGLTRLAPGMALNTYDLSWLAYKHLARFGYGSLPYLTAHPPAWPQVEVNLFASQKKFRGRGVGRKLMDAFIRRVRKRGLAQAHVCTDTAVSYRFYEIYGFKRLAGFNQKAYLYSLGKEKHRAFVYQFKTGL